MLIISQFALANAENYINRQVVADSAHIALRAECSVWLATIVCPAGHILLNVDSALRYAKILPATQEDVVDESPSAVYLVGAVALVAVLQQWCFVAESLLEFAVVSLVHITKRNDIHFGVTFGGILYMLFEIG